MNLLDSLKKTQTKRATQPMPGASANLTQMLAAKSGKAGTVTGPIASSIQEQQALADFNAQATQQQQAAQVDVAGQQQQLDQVNQRAGQQMQQLTQQREGIEQQFNQGVEKIERGLDRLQKDIDSKEGQQALQQLVFSRRLGDDKYLAQLKREGQQRRLEDRQQYQLAAAEAAFGRIKDAFESDAQFQRLMEADTREFNSMITSMDMEFANTIIAQNEEAANRQAQMQAYGTLAQSFIQAGTTSYNTTDSQGNVTNASAFERLYSDQPLTSYKAPESVPTDQREGTGLLTGGPYNPGER